MPETPGYIKDKLAIEHTILRYNSCFIL